jgi:oligopeptidase B
MVHDPEAFADIKSHAPYENVQRARYPVISATVPLIDTQVSYAGAAK